jgi:hypothetical protein
MVVHADGGSRIDSAGAGSRLATRTAEPGKEMRNYNARAMGAWYWIGVAAGLGAAVGVLLAGAARTLVAVALAVAAGAGVGVGIDAWQPGGWGDIVVAAVAGGAAALGAGRVVRGALARGGTRGGTVAIVAGVALVAGGLAWVPALGYLLAVLLPVLAVRLRRRAPERYAGLRTLARD